MSEVRFMKVSCCPCIVEQIRKTYITFDLRKSSADVPNEFLGANQSPKKTNFHKTVCMGCAETVPQIGNWSSSKNGNRGDDQHIQACCSVSIC